jgi:hypothetical protein
MIASTLFLLSQVIVPPFSGGTITDFSRHLRRYLKATSYTLEDGATYIGPTKFEHLPNNQLRPKTSFVKFSVFEKKSSFPAALEPVGKSPLFTVVVKPTIYSKSVLNPGTLTLKTVSLEKPGTTEIRDTFAMGGDPKSYGFEGMITLKNLKNFKFSRPIKVPYFFEEFKISISDYYTSETDFISHLATTLSCSVVSSEKEYILEPNIAEIKTRLIETCAFYFEPDGSYDNKKISLKSKVLNTLSDKSIRLFLVDKNYLEKISLGVQTPLYDSCLQMFRDRVQQLNIKDERFNEEYSKLEAKPRIEIIVGKSFDVNLAVYLPSGIPIYLP